MNDDERMAAIESLERRGYYAIDMGARDRRDNVAVMAWRQVLQREQLHSRNCGHHIPEEHTYALIHPAECMFASI